MVGSEVAGLGGDAEMDSRGAELVRGSSKCSQRFCGGVEIGSRRVCSGWKCSQVRGVRQWLEVFAGSQSYAVVGSVS